MFCSLIEKCIRGNQQNLYKISNESKFKSPIIFENCSYIITPSQ